MICRITLQKLTHMGMEEQSGQEELWQVVMFELAGEIYGIGMDIVQEVIRLSGVSHIPQALDFVEGVINLRGYFIPIVDLKKRFHLGSVEASKSARIMIIEVEEKILGITVDRVLEVVSIPPHSIEPPSPLIQNTLKTDYLIGFSDINDQLVKILDFEKIFSSSELSSLKELEEHL